LKSQKLPGQEELYAALKEPEDQIQTSVLKQIPKAYKEYKSLFQKGPPNEKLPLYKL